jgi:hypothetical protein
MPQKAQIANLRTCRAISHSALAKENDRFFSTALGLMRAAPF